MTTVIRMRFGSHLYGTATPQSDIDLKTVYIPEGRSILLQRASSALQLTPKRPKNAGEKNYAGEMDEEAFSLQRYLALLTEGQTVSLDMLFSTPDVWIETTPVWSEIVANRHRLLTKRSSAFVGYCRQQANKYGIKGSRIASARAARELFASLIEKSGTHFKLADFASEIEAFAETQEHCAIIELQAGNSPGQLLKHFDCCGRKMPWTVTLKMAFELYDRIFQEYGSRARQAEANEGVDWKALSHAVRVANEALELMSTGKITFPLTNREHILAIKQGKCEYKEVAEEIERLLIAVEAAEQTSILPEKADTAWIDEFVVRHHLAEVSRFSSVADRGAVDAETHVRSVGPGP